MAGQTYDILIRTAAELEALKASQTELKDLVAASKAAGVSSTALEEKLKGVDQALAGDKLGRYAQQLQGMVAQEQAAGRSTAELERHLRDLGTAADNAGGKDGGGLAQVFGGSLLANAASQVAAKVRETVEAAIDLGDKLSDLSARSGVAASSIQLIGNAASVNGGSLEAAAEGLSKLTINAAKAENGSKPLVAAFDRLGISAAELKNLTPDQLFLRIADGVSHATDRGQAYADVVAVMGKGSKDLFATLALGSDEIRKTGEAMGVFSDETVARLGAAKDALDAFKNQLTILAGESVSFAAKMKDALGTGFADLFSRAFGLSTEQIRNFELIETKAAQSSGDLKDKLKAAAVAAGELGDETGRAADALEKIDAKFASRTLSKLPLALQAEALRESIKKLKAEAGAELPGIKFDNAANLNTIANGLPAAEQKEKVKGLAVELAKLEDQLEQVAKAQTKAAEATKGSTKASDEAAKAISAEIATLREKAAALDAASKATLNPTRGAELDAERQRVLDDIARREKSPATAPATATPALPAPQPGTAPTPQAGGSADAAETLRRAIEQTSTRLDDIRLIAEQAQAELPAKVGEVANALGVGFDSLAAALAPIPASVNTTTASLSAQITALGETIAAGLEGIAKATAGADAKLQRQIDIAKQQIANIG